MMCGQVLARRYWVSKARSHTDSLSEFHTVDVLMTRWLWPLLHSLQALPDTVKMISLASCQAESIRI
jgi:hypothetical protein